MCRLKIVQSSYSIEQTNWTQYNGHPVPPARGPVLDVENVEGVDDGQHQVVPQLKPRPSSFSMYSYVGTLILPEACTNEINETSEYGFFKSQNPIILLLSIKTIVRKRTNYMFHFTRVNRILTNPLIKNQAWSKPQCILILP